MIAIKIIIEFFIKAATLILLAIEKEECKNFKSVKEKLICELDPKMLDAIKGLPDRSYVEAVFSIWNFTPRNRIHTNQILVLAGKF